LHSRLDTLTLLYKIDNLRQIVNVSEQRKKKNGGGWNKGKKGKKATNEVIEQRVDQMAKYLREHPLASRFDLHKKFCRKFGLVWQTVDVYADRARRLLRRESNMTPDQARGLGVGVLHNLLNDRNPAIRIKAEQSLRDIFGYSAPTQHRIGSPDGSPLPSTVVAPTVIFEVVNKKQLLE
jgi:hypothetical protein